ncbi:hypothetical protein E4O01_07465 [Treponema sp. OMZ 790]|uniref:hypothetical protein n=1 Tax=Treponema sp. OMZ 790 TaxID=2563665 RepID=UPI0020A45D27|nr:hypothetical protein [Treponema sp. OMZ 790]UTC68576.1 hypothetical protein E4O01_07465 [Treponema sp. OMZ 790]
MCKKLFFLIISLAFILSACNQFLANIETDLAYWASTVQITDIENPPAEIDENGYFCLPSTVANEQKIILKLINPQKYELKEAVLGSSSDIVLFESGVKGRDGTSPPKPGVDYELKQTAPDRVELIYKRDFLEYSEWGSQDLSPKITLYGKDGRKFEQSYNLKLKANTKPPALEYKGLYKSGGYYVLCFKAKNMTDMAKVQGVNQPLHKDIAYLWVSGLDSANKINITVGTAGFNITGSGGRLLNAVSVEPLVSGGTKPTDPWIIYFKTDLQVSGGTPKEFTLKLMDEKCLSGAAIKRSTSPSVATWAELHHAVATASAGMTIEINGKIKANDGSQTIDGNSYPNKDEITIDKNLTIQGKGTDAELDANQKNRIFNITAGKTLILKNIALKNGEAPAGASGGGAVFVSGSLEISGAVTISPSSGKGKNDVYLKSGTKITVKGDLSPAGGIVAHITPENYTGAPEVIVIDNAVTQHPAEIKDMFNITPQASGYHQLQSKQNNPKTIIVKQGTVISSNSWSTLKSQIQGASNGDYFIVENNVTATSTDFGQIEISKNLTIQGKDSGVEIDAAQKSRIFKVASGKNLTLKNLTLKNAKDNTEASIHGSGGGGVYADAASNIELIDVTIKDCETAGSGPGIRIDYKNPGGGYLLLKNSKIMNNTYNPVGYNGYSISGGGVGLPYIDYTAVIDGCEILGNKIDLRPISNTDQYLNVKGCGIDGGNVNLIIKGKTKIENNTFIPKPGKKVKSYGMGIYNQFGTITIGENGASHENSPIIKGHTKPNNVASGSLFEGQALHVNDFTWYSGQITNNGGSHNAVKVRGTFTNPNNLQAN